MTTQWKPDGTICQACWGSGCRYCDARKATPTEPTGAQADEFRKSMCTSYLGYSCVDHKECHCVVISQAAEMIESLQRDLEAARAAMTAMVKERDEALQLLAEHGKHDAEVDASLRAQIAAATGERDEWKKNCSLLTHQLITCGVAASHPDATLSSRGKDYGGPWDSPQAQQVRTLRADRDQLRAQLASAEAEIGNIAHAKRFDRAVFWSDTEFADWAQSRCHAALSSDAAANKERE